MDRGRNLSTNAAGGANTTASKAIAGALDGLVRSVKLGTAAAPEAAERLARTWLQTPEITLEIGAGALSVAGAEVFKADADNGRWVLPAFMAGLRKVAPRPDLRGGDLLSLCGALGGLVAEQQALDGFRTWLWADGVEGVRTELTTGFTELLETSRLDVDERKETIKIERARMAAAMATARVARLDLQAAAATGALDRPLLLLKGCAERAPAGPSDNGASELVGACEDESMWAREAVALAFAMPGFRGSLPADVVARQLVRSARERCGRRELAVLASLLAQGDDFAVAVGEALAASGMGTLLAERASLQADEGKRLGDIAAASAGIAAQLVRGLLTRATGGDDDAHAALVVVAERLGAEAFFVLVDLTGASDTLRREVTRLAAEVSGGAQQLVALFDRVGHGEAVQLLPSVPIALLPKIQGRLRQLLTSANPRQRSALADAMIAHGAAAGAGELARLLGQTKLRGWDPSSLRRIVAAAIERKSGVPALIEAVHDGEVATGLRVMLLERLAASPSFADAVLERRLKELMYPADLKRRLAELRKGARR